MELFGHEIAIKEYNCGFNGAPGTPRDEKMALFVRFKGCNANCKFCEYMDDASLFDLKKYREVLEHLKEKIWVDKVNMTGGEPTINWDLFKKVLNITREVFPDTYVVLNTNGFKLEQVFEEEEVINKLDNIALSRHHYDDKINEEILRTKAPSSDTIKNICTRVETEEFHITCNLIKGYIDNKEEAHKFLEWASSIKAYSTSFVSLMPINDYCKESFIDFTHLELNDKLHLTQEWDYPGKCSCNNWIYFPDNNEGTMLRVYTKNTYAPETITSALVFDGKNVRVGFTEKIIA
jgi:pyruvate-formate lyase-activating enzyme